MPAPHKAIEKYKANGHSQPAKVRELPPWLLALRTAVEESVKPDDITAIMSKQVEKALKGDTPAASMVMKLTTSLIKAGESDPAPVTNNTLVLNNNPPRPKSAVPDESLHEDELEELAERAKQGLPIKRGLINGLKPVSDEEEKAMRRREEEARRADVFRTDVDGATLD